MDKFLKNRFYMYIYFFSNIHPIKWFKRSIIHLYSPISKNAFECKQKNYKSVLTRVAVM